MTILGAWLDRRSAENPGRPLTDASLLDALGGMPTESGESVTAESAFRMVAVYRSISLLAGLIGAMPWHAYRRRGAAREAVDVDVVDNPHPDKTPFEVKEFIGLSLLAHGNAYSLKNRDGLGRVAELEPLHPANMVRVERKKDWRSDTNPSGKRFTYRDGTVERTYTAWEVLHIPALSYDGLVGMSPIAMARQAIGTGLAAESFGARLFARGALIQGVLTGDKPIDEAVAKRLKKQWRNRFTGEAGQWDIPVMGSGLTFQPVSLPPADAQFIETRKFSITEIARLFGLPPHLIGDVEKSSSWGTGIEQQNMQMLTYTADPWLVRIEERVTQEAILDSSTYVKFNRGALLRSDMATRFMAYQRAINNGWQNADEIRALEEQDPLPDGAGKTFYRPSNVVPVQTPDEAAATEATTRELTEMIQKVYLGLDKVLSADEAREILNRAGAGLDVPWPQEGDE